ncbi:4-alpha-glucanotransferase [Teredinibacter haidensis]|uniref:4-alpha-glucanotransferase n=1 Tax=Teredinibacter haidensis TaxID=2731755 RepID=UPI0009FB3115|nr:4-alpha-glucanotransferase [Teredinibacter haidensis]
MSTDKRGSDKARGSKHSGLMGERSCGVLLHISSLPSEYGIGDMGAAAYFFARQLRSAGQKYWQMLPLNPSNAASGESPYFSSSAFAGNPLLIDLQALIDEGLIDPAEFTVPDSLPDNEVDFTRVREFKLAVLYKAAKKILQKSNLSGFREFCTLQRKWLDDFVLFTVLLKREGKRSWSEWPEALRDRHPKALDEARQELSGKLEQEKVLQYIFFTQWQSLKNYCNSIGLDIFGDMPIYVSYESADVWANSQYFKLDAERKPTFVSGVPPDYFSATGQLWNNPVYNWECLRADHYQWWVQRMAALFERFDIVRIDHFRGLVQYWEVPAGQATAINGRWRDVPSYDFFNALLSAFTHFPVVVEDLGIITPDVVAVKEHYDFPGMLVLQFAFFAEQDEDENPYLPPNHVRNALAYLGSHDNTTARAWYEEADVDVRQRLEAFLENDTQKLTVVEQLLDLLMSSKADIAIVTVQDVLNLPASARMNDPAVNEGNWKWRLSQNQFDALPIAYLAELTQKYQRS